MRLFLAFIAGGLFGAGLLISGMTDTKKLQDWLDIFGDWDPTLTFVMGGAIIPMAVAWRLTKVRAPLVGGEFQKLPEPKLERKLILGSLLFGLGWGLVGLCPGPTLASLSFGGWANITFILAMLVGMFMTPKIGRHLWSGPIN
ncbi:DUF6691 family protein [Planktotalea sp.]|uniref:DUF6691 family protein n=1 Tax=Planktotalea sp. TaxID=2029877 RepID=UPI0025E2339A|nr:DUF6691 family protein [Planktotalea sp.]